MAGVRGSPALDRSFSRFFKRDQEYAAPPSPQKAEHPVYWKKKPRPLAARSSISMAAAKTLSVMHVNWYEAGAYCRWRAAAADGSGREMAAAGKFTCTRKNATFLGRRTSDTGARHLDGRALGLYEVGALPKETAPSVAAR